MAFVASSQLRNSHINSYRAPGTTSFFTTAGGKLLCTMEPQRSLQSEVKSMSGIAHCRCQLDISLVIVIAHLILGHTCETTEVAEGVRASRNARQAEGRWVARILVDNHNRDLVVRRGASIDTKHVGVELGDVDLQALVAEVHAVSATHAAFASQHKTRQKVRTN